jgi:hypothetical protein
MQCVHVRDASCTSYISLLTKIKSRSGYDIMRRNGARVCVYRLHCDVDSPLWCYNERILLPHSLALGNRLLRDESFPLFPIEIFVFDGCCPSGDVKTFDERGRWVNARRLRPSSRRS